MGAPTSRPTTANALREAFLGFFAAKGHARVPSASLIPHDPTVLFTVAGMVPFKPYFLGDEVAPWQRAVSVQKCARAGGKHNDLDDVGRTKRHLVFFEMMGNFSFGDYFKSDAIPWSWELVTEVFGFDGDRLWITVHTSDDEAEAIWHEQVGVPMERIQRLGDDDNFWQMGETGPCGPCSEIHIDRGPAFGPEGGPANDPHGDRFLEFWNLVFMQYNQSADGHREPLPRPSIDTGAGLERILALMQETDSVWETDVLAPIVDAAQSISGRRYRSGDYEDRDSFSLRVLAEHARSTTMLVSDGVFPSNEGRGYVLRRIMRRAIRHAYLLGVERETLAPLVERAIDVMGVAYPDVVGQSSLILDIVSREEKRFRDTLRTGLSIFEDEIARDGSSLSGSSAFLLHDTYGFPLELTQEIAGERGVAVDVAGFDREMTRQRERAKAARKSGASDPATQDAYRAILDAHGQTTFVGYSDDEATATVVAVLAGIDDTIEVFLDVTPFYAESGGQVGDTGFIETDDGTIVVLDTTFALPGLRRHVCRGGEVAIGVGDSVRARIDTQARARTRRNHTATHVLHWALREVLGEHVKQAGSLVAPDRLRFDFTHYAPVSEDEIARIEDLANAEVLANPDTRVYETSKEEAAAAGAIAFFGDKYGDRVRVLEAGPSLELCGGTHVTALGDIGAIKIVAESSIGSNLRRIEATTGDGTLRHLRQVERTAREAADLLGAQSGDLLEVLKRRLEAQRETEAELRALRAREAATRARELATTMTSTGVVTARVDGLSAAELRDLAVSTRQVDGVRVVVLVGRSDTGGASLVAAVRPETEVEAASLLRDAAKAVGGGGGGKGDIATAGGKDPAGLDRALEIAASAAHGALA